MIFKVKRAQSTVEYLGLFVIIIGLFVIFLTSVKGSLDRYHRTSVDQIATG